MLMHMICLDADYGESTYVGPLTGAIPSSTTWINDFDHQGIYGNM